MIEFRLDKMLEKRQRSAYWLAQETGISESMLWRIRHAKTQGIQWQTLERICEALECQPGDLIVKVDEQGKKAKRTAKAK